MALLRRSGSRFTTNIWPGFVDAMTALLLVLMFVLSIFMIIQTIFREKISGQKNELTRLESEVIELISDLKGQKKNYADLNSSNLLIKKELELQKQKSLDRFHKLKNALDNLDLANIKISDFEVRVASLIARRTQLLTEIQQKDTRLKKEISRLEASRLALASAREEIDSQKEMARLAAAKREALNALVKELNSNLNNLEEEKKGLKNILDQKDMALILAYQDLEDTKTSLSSVEKASLIQQAAIENLKDQIKIKSEEIIFSSNKMVLLEEDNKRIYNANETLIKDLEEKEKTLTNKEQELLFEKMLAKKIRQELTESVEKLKESEKLILVEQLAVKKLRERLIESREEIELATLSLEEERKRALENLELIAASETAKKILNERNIELNNENNKTKSALVRTVDLLKVREVAIAELRSQLLSSNSANKISVARIKNLNEETLSLAKQLKDLQSLLEQYEQRDIHKKVQVKNLGYRLNAALAQIVIEQKKNSELEALKLEMLKAQTRELKNYRSQFFGDLRKILGDNKGIEIVGDRFLFPSEVLFDVGSDKLEQQGKNELAQMALVIKKILNEIPKNIDWILRVDGHTDKTKFLTGGNFKDNWELSQARALSVVRYFVYEKNLPARRFAAVGFGEFQPIDLGNTDEAFARNRRIEIKLTER